jgi:hypothetical protein
LANPFRSYNSDCDVDIISEKKLSPHLNSLDVERHEKTAILSFRASDTSVKHSRHTARNKCDVFPLEETVKVDIVKLDGSINAFEPSKPLPQHNKNEEMCQPGENGNDVDLTSLVEEETTGDITTCTEKNTTGRINLVNTMEGICSSSTESSRAELGTKTSDDERLRYPSQVSIVDHLYSDKLQLKPKEVLRQHPFSVDIDFDKRHPAIRVVSSVASFSSVDDNVIISGTSRQSPDSGFKSLGESVDLSGLSLKVRKGSYI